MVHGEVLISCLNTHTQVINENASPLLPQTLAALGLNETAGLSADDFTESNLKHSINGRIFCNADGFDMTLGTM